MMILNAGVTHKTATIPILESCTFKDPEKTCQRLLSEGFVEEAVILQTCNRVELYACHNGHSGQVIAGLLGFWAEETGVPIGRLSSIVNFKQDREVYVHLVRLASGLDSMVVGEDQIVGQMKGALKISRRIGAAGQFLETVFELALRSAAKVRSSTMIGRGAVSVGSVAARLAANVLGSLKDKASLLIGAGETGLLVAKSLKALGQTKIYIASRTMERAVALSRIVGGTALPFDEALTKLKEVHLVAVATSATYYLLTEERVRRYREGARSKLVIFDLSNPRNVEEKVDRLSNTIVYTIDDLRKISLENLEARLGEVEAAEKMILEQSRVLQSAVQKLGVEPFVSKLYKKADLARRRELAKAVRSSAVLRKMNRRTVEDLTAALTEGLFERPIKNIRGAAQTGDDKTFELAQEILSD